MVLPSTCEISLCFDKYSFKTIVSFEYSSSNVIFGHTKLSFIKYIRRCSNILRAIVSRFLSNLSVCSDFKLDKYIVVKYELESIGFLTSPVINLLSFHKKSKE